MPDLLAAPIPANMPRGTLITSAHGQDTTRKVSARYSQSAKTASGINSIGSTTSAIARKTTVGVYTFAKRVMNFSIGAFLLLAFSTSSRIRDTVDSPYSLLTSTFSTPLRLTTPASTSSCTPTSLGRDSPVRAEVSRELVPSTITPSSGTRSPGLITIRS